MKRLFFTVFVAILVLVQLVLPAQASEISDVWEIKILDAILNQTNITAPTNIYLALYTTATNDSSGGTEATGGSYARVEITSSFDAASGTTGILSNNSTITFPTATANWGTISHFDIRSASSGGDRIMYGALTSSKAVNSGDTAQVATGDLDITIASLYDFIDQCNAIAKSGKSELARLEDYREAKTRLQNVTDGVLALKTQ